MDKKIKSQWIKALLSGDYKQGYEHLKKNGRYCCLGVLADICGVLGQKNQHVEPNRIGTTDEVLNKHNETFLKKMGLDKECRNPFTKKLDSYQEILIQMNDGPLNYFAKDKIRRKTFKEIAVWIKKNIK